MAFMNRLLRAGLLATIMLTPGRPTGAPLFQENFNAASISGQSWNNWNPAFNETVPLGAGDYALKLTGTAGGGSGIYSNATYNRGQNLRVTFKLWNSGGFQYTTIGGPWVHPNALGQGWTYPGLNWVEAGFAGQDNNGSQTFWGEGSAIWSWQPLEPNFLAAWQQANSKASALLVRVLLGNATGARLEWSRDGGLTFEGVQGAAGPFNGSVIDTRGRPAGQNYYAANKVSSTSVKIGFSGGYQEATYIDDLVVENDANSAPTPTPTPSAQQSFPFSETFETEPFAGATPRWQAFGNCTWSTAQAHGGSRSIRLEGQSPYTQANRLVTQVNGIPQTGTIEVKWHTYFTQFDNTNINHLMHFGTNAWGEYPTLTIGAIGARLAVYDGDFAWKQGPQVDLPPNTWIQHRVIFYQDYDEYDYYVKIGLQEEIAFAQIEPLGSSLWGGGVNYRSLMIMPFVANTFFLDDVSVGLGPTPLPTPTPYPTPGPVPTSAQLLDIGKIMPPGEFYADRVPDTLDLAERARLSINALTRTIAPGSTNCYHLMYFGTNPPIEDQPQGYTYKHIRALPKLRTMCGSDQNLQVEFNLMKAHLDATAAIIPQAGHAMNMNSGGVGMAVANWHARDGNPLWLQYNQALSRALERAATYDNRRDYAYYGSSEPESDTNPTCDGSIKFGYSFILRAMMANHGLTGDAITLTQAGRIIRFLMLPKMWDQQGDVDYSEYAPYAPQYPGESTGAWSGQSHAGLTGLHGMASYAITAGDAALQQFVRKGYEHCRSVSVTRLGWSPLWFPRGSHGCTSYGYAADACEPCSIGDMTVLAVLLSEAGIGEYWDDVDGYLRNGLAEQQITDVNRLRQISGSTSAVLDKYVGASVAANRPAWGEAMTWGCCTVNTAIALYYGWHGAAQYDAAQRVATVNLLLNRAAAWGDVYSHLPYEGKVEVRVKQARGLRVRMPGWVDLNQVAVTVNGGTATPTINGRYLQLSELNPNDRARFTFPVAEGTENIKAGTRNYQLHVRGGTVLTVSPNAAASAGETTTWDGYTDKKYALYERANQNQGPAPTRDVTRFVAERIIPLQSQWATPNQTAIPARQFNAYE